MVELDIAKREVIKILGTRNNDDLSNIFTKNYQLYNIELITCENGDWEVLKVDGDVFSEGHSIKNQDWICLIKKLGFAVNEKEILD